MNEQEVISHFRNYYRYGENDMDEETARSMVNMAFPQVLKNDRNALKDVLCIVREQAYYKIVVSQVRNYPKIATIEHVDNAMQQASLKYLEKSMTNFDNFYGDDFYAYSIVFFRMSVMAYMREYYYKVDKRENVLDEEEHKKDERTGDRQQLDSIFRRWKFPQSNPTNLLHIVMLIFCPLYSKTMV